MSQRLTALSQPSNSRWVDIVVVAEGSEVAGYSVTPSDFAKAKRIKVAIERIYGAPLEKFIEAYNDSKKAVLAYLKLEDVSYKKFITSSNNQVFLNAVLKRAYRLAEGQVSNPFLPTKEITRFLNYEAED